MSYVENIVESIKGLTSSTTSTNYPPPPQFISENNLNSGWKYGSLEILDCNSLTSPCPP
jgi:hypothetical protein